jgi:hypothetical protein
VLKSHSDVPPGIDQRAIQVTQDGGDGHDFVWRRGSPRGPLGGENKTKFGDGTQAHSAN